MIQDKISKISLKLYNELGVKGMESLTDEAKDYAILNYLLKFLNKNDRILDLACGYGRIANQLALQGFKVEGLDLVPKFIKEARRRARTLNLKILFKVGDMRELPYNKESFDKVLCVWSSFNHLLDKNSQIKSLKEIWRVLAPRGLCLIDMPNFKDKWSIEQIKKFGRIAPYKLHNLKVFDYIHDEETLKEIINLAGFSKYKIKLINLNHRKRIMIFLKK